ncbi:acyl-CoA thioesterase [Mumia quercus]|uniref:acyl-CoA thioesterase n=1 Tax=Mumia quercus TaxID=2976125 RepID=UPI0021D04E12|nr:acyl-[acyl-carrier-protein] thioesterase [Mumia quercus]
MRHTYACAMRWADMDALNHVNNVAYADYLREARLAYAEEAGVRARPMTALAIDYRAPLVFRPEPVLVTTTVEDDVLVQEISDRREDGTTTVYVQARTTLADGAPPAPLRPDEALTGRLPVAGRARDLGVDGDVDQVATLELLQEARVAYATVVGARGLPWVVVRSETTFVRPLPRRATYAVHAGIGKIGRSSFEIVAQLVDDAQVFASSRNVMIGFDPEAGRARPLTDGERTQLEPHVVAG